MTRVGHAEAELLYDAMRHAIDQVLKFIGIWVLLFVLTALVLTLWLGYPGAILAVFPGTVIIGWFASKLA